MSIITLADLSYRTPDGKTLLSNLDLAFGQERTGIVGANGAGKTTLLRLILGDLQPSGGGVSVRGRLGVLRQDTAREGERLADLLGVGEALARLARIEAGEGSEADFAEADWTLEARLDAALAEVGLAGLALDRPASALSGGQQTRAALAGLLAAEPDMLLLDEPTNHLDAEARAMVAGVLARWRGGAIVVSHDRALLEGMDRIVELSSLGARVYGGGYSLYVERKAEERAGAARALDRAEREVRQVERDAQAAAERQARRDSAGRRFAAKGSEPKILLGGMAERAENSGARGQRLAERQRAAAADALGEAQAAVERTRTLGFTLPSACLAAGKAALILDVVSFAWPGGDPVLHQVSLRLDGPERVAVTGPNGAGKSTLLRLAAGHLEPVSGRVVRPVPAALLDQHAAMLDLESSVLANFRRLNPDLNDNAARAALAQFLFRNVAAEAPVASLSGGERLRAGLACVLAGERPPQLLILDEPTNHLDLPSIAAVEAALSAYDGALLVVSHDAAFLDAIGTERRIDLGPS